MNEQRWSALEALDAGMKVWEAAYERGESEATKTWNAGQFALRDALAAFREVSG